VADYEERNSAVVRVQRRCSIGYSINRVDWCPLIFGLLCGSLGTLREIMYGVVVMEA